MPIRFTINGIAVECDAVQEAADLIRALSKQHADARQAKPLPPSRIENINGDDFDSLWGAIEPNGRDLLKIVARQYPNQIEAEKLAPMLETDTNGVGWIRRKMKSSAENLGETLETWLKTSKVEGADGKPKTAYVATKQLVDDIQNVSA